VGVDAVRGLAVLGMFAAHVGYAQDDFWTSTGWLAVADGRSAATFALLAGVSIALMSGGAEPTDPDTRSAIRRRLLVRAVVVAVIGYLLVALGTPIAVILPSYAVMFVLALPFLAVRPAGLLLGAGLVASTGPLLVRAAGGPALGTAVDLPGLLVTGYYPAAVWLAYVLVGLAVGRLPLRRASTQLVLLAVGGALALAGYGLGHVVARAAPELGPWFSIEPHADTTPEVVGNLGVTLVLLAAVLAAAQTRPGRVALTPLTATGAMALTVYTAQIVAIFLAGPEVVYDQTTNGTLLAFTVVTLVACTLWTRFVGRGPLERLMRAVSAPTAPRADVRDEARR
jgi:uncharacterized membrane protein YeiB